MVTPDEFRRQTAIKYRPAFELHSDVEQVMQSAAMTARSFPDYVSRAVDMLFVQAFKAHVSVGELAELALVEDAATIVRRLLELAIQAVYIARDSEEATRRQRAGAYLAFLWHQWPDEFRGRLPRAERKAWEEVYVLFGAEFKPTRKKWGPSIRDMFLYAEHPETYEQDYSFLSNVAHGAPPSLVHSYSHPTVPLHDDLLVPDLIIRAASYGLAITLAWNDVFGLVKSSELEDLRHRVVRARFSDQ